MFKTVFRNLRILTKTKLVNTFYGYVPFSKSFLFYSLMTILDVCRNM